MSDIDKIKAEEPAVPEAVPAKRRAVAAWIAVALAVAAWFVLMYGSGYAAIATGVAAIGVSIWGIASNCGALRRLSIAALIAAAVLTIVVGAFILIIKNL